MLGIFRGETLDVLNPEEVVPVVRLPLMNGDGPGGGQQGGAQDGQRPEAHQLKQASPGQHIWDQHDHRYRQCDEPLGEKAHAAGETK